MLGLIFAAAFAAAPPLMPDNALTPGAINPAITQANVATTICVRGYTASIVNGVPVRNVSAETKAAAKARYGNPSGPIEIDHRVPLEVGGANDLSNLWPEYRARVPYSAWDKDKVEDWVAARICGRAQPPLTLDQGRAIFLGDWRPTIDAYYAAHPGEAH